MMIFRIKIWIVIVMIIIIKNANCQLSSSDSLFFSSIFTDDLYSVNPSHTNVFKHPAVTSTLNLNQQLSLLCPFSELNYNGCYNRMNVSTDFNYDTILNPDYNWYFNQNPNWGLGQLNPIIEIDFELDGISNQVSAIYTPSTSNTSSNCNTAFIIFPGSGPNNTMQVAHGIGYHAIHCHTKNLLKQKGDVYTYCKPNEDWRAIHWNNSKLSTEYGSAYLKNYLDSTYKHLSLNSTIEFIALLKFLKQKYSKVVFLALSHAGLNAVISLSEVNVDAYLISGGYTADTITFQNEISNQKKYFGNLYSKNPPSVIRNRVLNSNSNFHFCWAQTDGTIETIDKITENFIGTTHNLSYSYSHLAHSFPYCSTIDSFIQNVLIRPKPFIKQINTNITDSVKLSINFCGQAPFKFHILKDGNSLGNFVSNSNTFFISFTQEGKYVIDSLVDATNILGFRSDTFEYIKNLPSQSIFNSLSVTKAYPNPTSSFYFLEISSTKNKNGLLLLNDLTGRIIAKTPIRIQSGNSLMQQDFSHLSPGLYILTIKIDDLVFSKLKLQKN